jgi:uncharacterized protein (TIGR03437 family)
MRLFLFFAVCSLWAQSRASEFTAVVQGLSNPVDIQFPDDTSGRIFIVEQAGRIRIAQPGDSQLPILLDIRSKVSFGGERGLLGMALPPGFPAKRYFYVNYTDLVGNTVIARYRLIASSPDRADPALEEVILRIVQPAANHNGGQLAFGPDGYLYIGMGDGGGGNDQFGNAQNRRSLLGKMLRIDTESGVSPYRVPPDNPFSNDTGYAPEIWALGLRNPWRFSFDGDEMWIADVGQNAMEEIDLGAAGANYGWPIREGDRCLVGTTCTSAGFTAPLHTYPHENGNVSITGGYVYRGSRAPSLRGQYYFADYASGRIWSLLRTTVSNNFGGPPIPFNLVQVIGDRGFNISTFGRDPAGELYVADHAGGAIYRLDPPPEFSVVNAASFQRVAAPGMIASGFASALIGQQSKVAQETPLPLQIDGVQVLFNGDPVSLYGIASGQVNFQVPFAVTANSDIRFELRKNGANVASSGAFLIPTAPGIFALGGTADAIVVRNSDYSLVTADRPAEPGESVFFYATGLGQVAGPQPFNGVAAPLSPLQHAATQPIVLLNKTIPCPVDFAGLAPGFVGLFQVNIRIPAGVPAGVAELVVISSRASNPVRLYVR